MNSGTGAEIRRIRTQLSLYVPEAAGVELEAVRRLLDPVQSGLIPAHVTLCREDELIGIDLDAVAARLADARPVTLGFGRPIVFGGHGVLLPCVSGEPEFVALRERALGVRPVRRHEPHITLAHPRNPRSPNNDPADFASCPIGVFIMFPTVMLIEQTGIAPWRPLREFVLKGD